MLRAPASRLSSFRIITDSIRAYPEVKFAVGLAAALSIVGLVYFFGFGIKLAILSLIPSIALLVILWLFAHAAHHAPSDFEVPANIVVQIALGVFTATVVLLFGTLVFGIPGTMRKIGSAASFIFSQADADRPVLLPDLDSEWSPARPKLTEVCASQRAIYEDRYPGFDINVVISSDTTGHGAQALYRYHCAFTATPK